MASTEATTDEMAPKRTRMDGSTNGYENQFSSALIEKLYLKTELADVHFVFGDNDNRERIPAHKCLLAGGSDVFKAMFYGDIKEKGDIEITDASADAFKEFLQFFYRSKVNRTVENTACQNISKRFLKDELNRTNDSMCSVYGLAIYFNLEDFIKHYESKIVDDPEAVFDSASFLDCDRSILSRILKFNELSCSEVKVFHACMNWVKAKAKQEELTKELVQAHLGELFYEIRFGSMTLEELADLTPSYGKLFSLDEYQEIVQMIRLKDFKPKMFKKDCRQPRVPPWNAGAVIECNRYVDGSTYFGYKTFKSVEKTTFTANKPVLLGGIVNVTLFNEIHKYATVEITIYEISSDGATKVLYHEQNVQSSLKKMFTTHLPKPILIKPEFKYEIDIMNSSSKQVIYHSYGLKDKIQLPGSDINIQFLGENKKRGVVNILRFNPISE